jgi:hypothetical protein
MNSLAEEKGFEPLVPFGTAVFKTAAFDHSATPPRLWQYFEGRELSIPRKAPSSDDLCASIEESQGPKARGVATDERQTGSYEGRHPTLVSPSGALDRARVTQNQGTGSSIRRQGTDPERSGSIVSRTATIVSRTGSKDCRMAADGWAPRLRSHVPHLGARTPGHEG